MELHGAENGHGIHKVYQSNHLVSITVAILMRSVSHALLLAAGGH